MAVPTITAVAPDEAHSGGALIEIVGTNFHVDMIGERVQVELIGGPNSLVEVADRVKVWSETRLTCFTPRLDPFEVTTEFTADDGTDILAAAAHGLVDGTLLQLATSDDDSILPAGLSDTVAYYVVTATTNDFQVSLTIGGAAVDLTDTGTGTFVAYSDGAYDVRITNLDSSDVIIGGETATAIGVFRPVRPDLTVTSSTLALVVEQFIVELKRQIHPNVSWSVNTDYDEETGDVAFAFAASLPAIILTELELPENRSRGVTVQTDDNYNDPDTGGDFVTYRRGALVNVEGSLLGVADNPIVILNLAAACRAFFQKNDTLTITNNDATTSRYQMRAKPDVTISPAEENTNIQWFTMSFRIVAVCIDQIPGLPRKTFGSVPNTGSTEAIVSVGHTAQIALDGSTGIDIDVCDLT